MLRSAKERILQTLCFEIGGLILTVPVFAALTSAGESDAMLTLALISVAVMCWVGVHNTVFDWIEFHITGRLASERSNKMRIVHAISHEITAIAFSMPILIWFGGLTWQEALLADIGLTLFYTAYAFIFYRVYDALRPMQTLQLQGV